ncbi:SH3 domain-containing protein [Phycomyces nitens]|nr:SH3 domain-containing protein [Phycomyces nitens]
MTDLYRAHHDYDAQHDDELSLKTNQVVRLTNADSNDWWHVQDPENGQTGIVPSNFLEKLKPETKGKNTLLLYKEAGLVLAKVKEDYAAQDPTELSLWKNGIVTVVDQSGPEGWWKGDLNGKTGLFPANYVELIDHSEVTEADGRFKLAAYGVKQGGIGSILAGGFPLRRNTVKRAERTEDHATPPLPTKSTPTIPEEANDAPVTATPESQSRQPNTVLKAMVTHDYVPASDDEIKLMRGEYVIVKDKDDPTWWVGINEGGQEGIFPSNFVQLLEPQQKPPVRPSRTRPPTIRTETPNSTPINNDPLSPLARPPPVPVTTRPASLLTSRLPSNASSNTSSTTNSPGLISPPPRPVTLPPTPSRRPSTLVTGPRKHTPRVPSLTLVAADLPPLVPKASEDNVPEHPVRPSRPIPKPATNQPDPQHPERTAFNLAKPPKIGAKPTPGSRPSSIMSSIDPEGGRKSGFEAPLSPPPMPRRSMPALPVPRDTHDPNEAQDKSIRRPEHPLPHPPTNTTSKSSTTSVSSLNSSHESAAPAIPSTANQGTTNASEDRIMSMMRQEIDKIRNEFIELLDNEREERRRLEEEVRSLRAQLE